jgi:hypothetical protein
MSITHTTSMPRALLGACAALLAGALLTACSSDDPAGDAAAGDASSEDTGFDRALAYAQCMRDNGVPDFPDPERSGGGVRITPGGGVDPDSSEFVAAQEACRDLAPQGMGNGGGTLDSARVAEWAQCLRDNGVPGFPDPVIDGGSMRIPVDGSFDPQDPAFQEAMDACQDRYPGGGVMFGGGPQ